MSHEDFHDTTLLLFTVIAAAKLFGILCEKIKIPALVGEISAGIILGNLAFFGLPFDFSNALLSTSFFQYASELGVLFLLFLVGLESNLSTLFKVGGDALKTALIGVVLPTTLGFLFVYYWDAGKVLEAALVGATLAATSIGITAKVLADYKKLKTPSAQVVLGAAVIDDVLGLIILAVLAGVATTGDFAVSALAVILIKVVLFFGGAFLFGHYLIPHVFRFYPRGETRGFLTAFAILLMLFFADVAGFVGLAPIVGAFTAGLLLDEIKLWRAPQLKMKHIEDVIKPLADFLLPVFFVAIGLQVNLNTLASFDNLLFIALLLLIALVGKALCGFACRQSDIDKLGVGYGMMPRGEVGLIFASFGLQQEIISSDLYSNLIFVVLMTTVLGPLFLRMRIEKF